MRANINTIKQNLVPQHKRHIKCPYPMDAEYVTIHNTANDAPASGEISYMISNNEYTSYHIAVDDIEAIQAIPYNLNGFHCGDGAEGTGNRKSVGIEICHSLTAGNPKYKQSEENGAWVAAKVLKDLGLGVDRIRKHQDWSGKYCPHRILDNGDWDNFKNKIQMYLDEMNGTSSTEEVKNEDKQRYLSHGTGTVLVDKLRVRSTPSVTSSSTVVAEYNAGQTLNFDSHVIAEGYYWLSYIGGSGNRRYIASGTVDSNGGSNKEYIEF